MDNKRSGGSKERLGSLIQVRTANGFAREWTESTLAERNTQNIRRDPGIQEDRQADLVPDNISVLFKLKGYLMVTTPSRRSFQV